MTDIDLPLDIGRALYRRLRQNIVDEMPTGSHRARAIAWDELAARCTTAARLHREIADARDADDPDAWYAAEVARAAERGPA